MAIKLFSVFSCIKSLNLSRSRNYVSRVDLSLLSVKNKTPQANIFLRRHLCSKSQLDFHSKRNIVKDTQVYFHSDDAFYKILSYFGIFQMVMWSYLSLFAVQQIKVNPVKDVSNLPLWKRLLYKEGQYKNALSLLSLTVGAAVLFISLTYPRRAIKSLWILKGGQDVKVTTYSWLGKTQTFQTPVEHISCMQSRAGVGQHIPLKLKGKNFYFLVDKKGSFPNVELFDFVIGVKRRI
ncbi:transmembrane protein 223-like [Physella acuta]|uniref:transmembrane protein 223-like n=1 Tax=Physella acuta TaxID=109671 RepID=UPI0027DC61A2|nr:transmembrane protein 223-like [Physella acuta]